MSIGWHPVSIDCICVKSETINYINQFLLGINRLISLFEQIVSKGGGCQMIYAMPFFLNPETELYFISRWFMP